MSVTAKLVCAVFGVGPGVGGACARKWAKEGHHVALIGRTPEKGSKLAEEICAAGGSAKAYVGDCTNAGDVDSVCTAIEADFGSIDTVVYNAAGSAPWKPYDQITPEQFESAWRGNSLGLFLVAQRLCPGMAHRGKGTLAVTGATASLRGKPFTTAFASGKAAQRSLAQSLARDLWPKGVHVFLVIIDGMVDLETSRKSSPDKPDEAWMAPDAIAQTYWDLHVQPKSCWTFEIDTKPNVESW